MTPKSATPILPLTSIRFFAAFYVVVLHSVAWSNRTTKVTWIGRFLSNGYVAVGFFFLLSGYILAHVYLDTDRPLDRRKFWIARFARVYPLLLVSLILDVPNAFIARNSLQPLKAAVFKTLFSFLTESALLQSLDGHFRAINAPSWSLSAEAFFYAVFPFLGLWIWRRLGKRAGILLLGSWLCAMAAPIVVTTLHPQLFVEVDSSKLQWAIELWPIFRIFEFSAGISLCMLQKSIEGRYESDQNIRLSVLFLVLAALLYCAVIQFATRIPLLIMSNGFLIPIEAMLILGMVNAQGWLKDLFSHRFLVVLGEASYAIYLLHSPIWLYLSRLHRIENAEWWLLYVAIVIAVSIASFYYLERPARTRILEWAVVRPRVILEQEEIAPL